MRILHISDIQAGKFNILADIKKLKGEKDAQEFYKSIIDDLKFIFNEIHQEKPIDIIIISGDIASEGIEEDYIEVQNTLIKMMENVFIKSSNPIPKIHWIIAPGNHDIQWGLDERRFNEFIKFCKNNGFNSRFELDNPDSIVDLIPFRDETSDIQIEFLVLNSCLNIFDKPTRKNADLSKNYFYKFADLIGSPFFKILICHHRLIEIANFNHNHCLEELRKKNIILALVGDFHKSSNRVDEVNGIKIVTAGSLLAKNSERVSGVDIMNREFNLYDIDLKTGVVDYITFIKTLNWEQLKRDNINLPFGTKSAKPNEDKKKVITMLKEIEDIIHNDHPNEDIIVNYMKSDFYTYMRNQEWRKASNQIKYKLNNEIESITSILYRIIKLRSFKYFVEKLEPELNIKAPLVIDNYSIDPLALAVSMRRGLPSWRSSLIHQIEDYIDDLNFVSENLSKLISNKGILLFLFEDQRKRNAIFTSSLFKIYREEIIKNRLKINLKEDHQYKVEILEQTLVNISNQIKIEDLDMIYDLLNNIQNDLELLKREIELDT